MTDKWKAIFGFALLFIIAVVAVTIALGKVEENTSYGLQIILGCFATLAGGFANWAFGSRGNGKGE
jgi:hypothetical protein